MFQISLPNSDFVVDVWLYVSYLFSTLICENTLFLSCFGKEESLQVFFKWFTALWSGKGNVILTI